MTVIFAIDPGTDQSGYVRYDGKVLQSGVMDNYDLLQIVKDDNSDVLAVELIVAQGAPVGQSTFGTCIWSGRFCQAWGSPDEVMWIPRREVKRALGLPGSSNDAKVNAKLQQVIGPKGTKSAKGPTFGVSSHAWAALGVAFTALVRISKLRDV